MTAYWRHVTYILVFKCILTMQHSDNVLAMCPLNRDKLRLQLVLQGIVEQLRVVVGTVFNTRDQSVTKLTKHE
jgi:hypothetical protein